MKKNLFYLMLLFLSFISCNEDNSMVNAYQDPFLTNNPGSSNKVLSKINYAEVGEAPYNIFYNWVGGKLMSVSTSNNSTSFNLTYTGSQISKIIQTTGQGTQLNTTTSNLVYSNGILASINGTSVSSTSNSNFTTTITYNGTRPTFIKRNYTSGSTTVYTESVAIEYIGANISKANTLFGVPSLQLNPIITFNTYDDKKNPFLTLPSAFSISNFFINQDAAASILGLNLNNFTNVSTSGPGVTPTTEVTVYTYGTDGYPTKSISPDYTLQYEYINL
ncbi:hypothetical protein [Frigoriflavimonas asaccharolytica]|uniref:YD repeat-containing protein n=1 Tax=Frigoriflavimonas asaccharolytica TaxID=2735899 RepID=A0A8J8GAP1_9FLAO|nr:hypothetical protein [Frigoriflavimonas asaccharolytica]NRS92152.1 hypothetical protein [Frigoriflavimonas asaccharolytica]